VGGLNVNQSKQMTRRDTGINPFIHMQTQVGEALGETVTSHSMSTHKYTGQTGTGISRPGKSGKPNGDLPESCPVGDKEKNSVLPSPKNTLIDLGWRRSGQRYLLHAGGATSVTL
jgi:hypothetical protein